MTQSAIIKESRCKQNGALLCVCNEIEPPFDLPTGYRMTEDQYGTLYLGFRPTDTEILEHLLGNLDRIERGDIHPPITPDRQWAADLLMKSDRQFERLADEVRAAIADEDAVDESPWENRPEDNRGCCGASPR